MYDWKFAGYESFPPTGTERIENGDTSGEVCVILVTRFPSDLSPTRRLNLSRASPFEVFPTLAADGPGSRARRRIHYAFLDKLTRRLVESTMSSFSLR